MKNIYTILEEIKFEEKIDNIIKLQKSSHFDKFLLKQSVFNIIQEFYECSTKKRKQIKIN